MKKLLKKLFSTSNLGKDGLTQVQREAMVDLLFYCMYADNSIASKEDEIIARTVDQFSWDPRVSYDAFTARSIANARAIKESPASRSDFIAVIAERLATPDVKARTLDLCRKICAADGDISAPEQELLRELQKQLG